MTLYNFAFFPKTCDVCDRMFIFEKYFTFQKTVGIEYRSVKFIECKFCHEKENETVVPSEENETKIETKQVCWKCGKVLDENNRSSLMYLSNPPKYTCKDCELNKESSKSYTKPLTRLISTQ